MIPQTKRTIAAQLLRRKVTEQRALEAGGELIEERSRYRFYRFADGSVIAIPIRRK